MHSALATQECRSFMGIATGPVVAGKMQHKGIALPEGAAVTVLTPDSAGELFLDAEDDATLLEAIAEAERGETIFAEELFARLDKRAKQCAFSFASRLARQTRLNTPTHGGARIVLGLPRPFARISIAP